MVLEGSEVKPKLRRQLRYVWSRRRTSQPRTDFKKKHWCTSGRKLIMDDDTLWNELEPYTSKVRKWSRKQGRSCRVLNSTIKRTHMRCKRVLTTMSYQTLARRLRLHHSRLGITKAKKKSDMCPCCNCYDHNVFPALTKEVHDLRMCIFQFLPQYFNAVEGCFHDLEGDGCLQRLTQHIEQSAGNKLLKMELTEEAMEALAIAEAEAIARLRALCAELSVYKMHFWLRDTLNERLWHDKLHPRKHTIYAWCDFADPLIL